MISELFLTLADAQAAPPSQGLGNMFVPFACIAVIFYFLIIRPQNKKQKDLENLVSSLKTGDKVVTTGGIHGIISNVKEGRTLILKIADNVKIEIDKSAISIVEKTGEPAAPAVVAS
jgi:preprotein translocase subunit YajC